ncbi:MAG TPA: ABC transporter permease subunit [Anaerolineales bacterium]|nr:ABC transporter permease subunit [Anaerolineales bacterium]
MSNEQKIMAGLNINGPSASALPTWWLVFSKDATDLWIGGKALFLVFIYTVVLGIVTYVISNSAFNSSHLREMVYETVETVIEVSLFIGLIISADSLSGERDRNTLESLLLTSASRRQIVVGKFLASITFWPIAFVLAIPTLKIFSQGSEVFGESLLWGGILGSIIVLVYVGLGMLVSFWSNTNKTSYIVTLSIYVMFLIPTEMPEAVQTGMISKVLEWINPLAAVNHFFSKIILNNTSFSEALVWLETPVAFAIIILGILFLYAAPGLRLEVGRGSKPWLKFKQNVDMGGSS